MSTSNSGSSRLELFVHSPACLFLLCTRWILAILIVKLIMHFDIFSPSRDVGNSTASVKSASKSKLSKVKRVMHLFLFFPSFVRGKWEAVRGINSEGGGSFTLAVCIIILEVLLEKVNHRSLSLLVRNVQISYKTNDIIIFYCICILNNLIRWLDLLLVTEVNWRHPGVAVSSAHRGHKRKIKRHAERLSWGRLGWPDIDCMPGIADCPTCTSNCHTPWDARLRQMQDKRWCCLPLRSFPPALPSSSHLLFAPSCFSHAGAVWLIWMWWQRKKWAGGFVGILSLSLPLFFPHQVVRCLFPPAHLKRLSRSPHVMQNAYQHNAKSQTRVEDMEFGKPTFNLTLSTSFTSHYMFLFVSPGDTDPSPGGSSK